MLSTKRGHNVPHPTNYVSYELVETRKPRIGHYNLADNTIQPLSFISGTPIETLYQAIEAGESFVALSGEVLPASSVKILPPLADRDVLCVGKNYAEHAKEFNKSGFDSSDKADQPTHPVIFTKRFTSIIAHGEDIYPHPDFTETADYEGEIGIIIGKAGFRVKEEDAMDHVWGYTIINDVTARERQRDHKQFYIGKSPDTFCPMGPIAVPASHLDKELRVQTRVNGELRQDATTRELIFSIPYLIKTMSEGQTLIPGDVLATGTPVGVGIGRKPPVYLRPGDEVTVSVDGLGTLTNRIADPSAPNPTVSLVQKISHIQATNATKAPSPSVLTTINGKSLYYKALGSKSSSPIVFIHDLGGTSDYYTPLIEALKLDQSHQCHVLDLEGCGLSPTHPLSTLSISSFACDLYGVFEHTNITSSATIIAHGMGCLVALRFALAHPKKVSRLILLGPPPSALPEAARTIFAAHATKARTRGMPAVLDDAAIGTLSCRTQASNPLAAAVLRGSLLGQDPEGYAKVASAVAGAAENLDVTSIRAKTLIVAGSEDKAGSPSVCEQYKSELRGDTMVEVLDGVGHWHVLEDLPGLAAAVEKFLK